IRNGSFFADDRGHTENEVFYIIKLTVRDSGGRTGTAMREVHPRKSAVTLATVPSGLQLTLDGRPLTAPQTFIGVEGVIRSIGAVTPQSSGGETLAFRSWSDGGAATHEIRTPANDTTFTAAFDRSTCVTAVSGGGFVNSPFTSQSGRFTAEFDATPSVSPINSVIELSRGPVTAHTGSAA